MDYKKKYEEALDNFKKIKAANKYNNELVNFIEYKYPELKENEDERIRNFLISKMKEVGNVWKEYSSKDIIAWLEKQKKVEPKFKVGDWVVPNNGEPRVFRVEERGWPDSVISGSFGNEFINTFTLDKQYHLWTIQDAKAGDVLADDYGIYIFEKFDECDENSFVCIGAYEYSEGVYECVHMLCSTGVHPATKEQRDLLFTKMKEAGTGWDAVKKELKKVESKSAWSEEDGKIIDEAISLINMLASGYGEKVTEPITFNGVKMINNVKENLRNLHKKLNHWKPSVEQMNFLWKYAEQNNYDGAVLTSLFRDLEKLMDE